MLLGAAFPKQSLFVRTAGRGLLVFHDRHGVVERIGRPVTLGAAVMVDQEVARHARHPSCKAAVNRTVAGEGPVNPEENILRKVFGFGTVAGEPIADVENAPVVPTHKFLPGRAISLEALLDQLDVLLQRFISLES